MKTVNLEQAIRILAREAHSLAADALKPLGVSPLRYDILETIARNMDDPGDRAFLPKRISEKVYMGNMYTREEIRQLCLAGYVRVAAGSSRLLTASGMDLLEECRAALLPVNRHMQRYFEDLGLEIIAEAFIRQQEGGN